MLVCADGIHSVGRRQMYPREGPPVYSGRILWRATTFARPYLSGASMIMAGHEAQKFVCYPIEPVRGDGLQRLNWIAELRAPLMREREDWNRPGQAADFLPRFEDWVFDWLDIPALIRGANEIFEYPLVDRDPLPRWSFGRVTLLGDAAHPMYPIGSNGASQAILDAAAIAAALTAQANVPEALRVYESVRLELTSKIVLANRQQGPEACMQLVEERAPHGFGRLEDVISRAELEEIAARYKAVAGFDRDLLNAMATV